VYGPRVSAVLLKATAGLLVPRGSAISLKYTTQPKNLIEGSCAAAKTAEKRGALDKNGKSQARVPGFTRPSVSYNAESSVPTRTEEEAWVCNQDGVSHKTREICFQKCRKRGLSGFAVVDCKGGGVTCLEATVDITLDIEIEVYGLEWKTSCAEGKRWNAAIRKHEKTHVDYIKKLKKSLGKLSKTIKVCAADETKARAALAEQMTAFCDTSRDEFMAAVDNHIEEFHGTAAGANAVLDCSKCP